MMRRAIVSSLVFLAAIARADDLAASRLLFAPVVASPFEPRLATEKSLNEGFLTLSIGNAVDVYSSSIATMPVRAGVEFFTWSRLQTTVEFRFPVEAIDYYFGLNATWASAESVDERWEGRLRLGHISAHTVDGQYDNYQSKWVVREPFTYSREFFDLLFCRRGTSGALHWRGGLGATLVLHTIPTTLGTFIPQWVVEGTYECCPAAAPYVSWAGRIQRLDANALVSGAQSAAMAWVATNSVQVGLRLGAPRGVATRIYLGYVAGASVHGEYFDRVERYAQAGIAVDY